MRYSDLNDNEIIVMLKKFYNDRNVNGMIDFINYLRKHDIDTKYKFDIEDLDEAFVSTVKKAI